MANGILEVMSGIRNQVNEGKHLQSGSYIAEHADPTHQVMFLSGYSEGYEDGRRTGAEEELDSMGKMLVYGGILGASCMYLVKTFWDMHKAKKANKANVTDFDEWKKQHETTEEDEEPTE